MRRTQGRKRRLFRCRVGFAGAFAGHGVPAFLHVRVRNFFELVLEHPLVAEGVGHAAAAETVELVGEGHEHAGSRRDGAVERGIGVFHHQAKGDGCAAERGRGLVAPLRVFLREHDEGAVDQEFGMDDFARFFIGQAVAFGGSEGGLVEHDGLRRVADAEVRAENGIVGGGSTHEGGCIESTNGPVIFGQVQLGVSENLKNQQTAARPLWLDLS